MRAIEARWSRLLIVAMGLGLLRACVFAPEVPRGPCTDDASCDDANPCTEDACAEDGYCDFAVLESPAPGSCADNNPCTKETCTAKGECTNVPDNTLVPDDGNECTEDACNDAQDSHAPQPDGAACGLNGGLKCSGGKCACTTATECGVSTACVTFECTGNACQSISTPMGTVVDNALEDDCQKNVCDGSGNVVSEPDVEDSPPDVTPNDCKKNACDTTGNIVLVTDTNDKPADDANACTQESCNAEGMPVKTNVADGMPCGAAQACMSDGSGSFQTLTQPVCSAGACKSANPKACGLYACNSGNTDCRIMCLADNHCSAAAYCDVGLEDCKAKLPQGTQCSSDSQCISAHCVDGVCCTAACQGICESCALVGTVGSCTKVPSGQDPSNECAGSCNGQGACFQQNGAACSGDVECTSGQCEDGTCCSGDCAGVCMRCDVAGLTGTCAAVGGGQQVGGCNGAQACDGNGGCKKANGQTCGANNECGTGACVDGVCCNAACTVSCKSCIGTKTTGGVTGVCDFIKAGTDPDNECSGSGTCNGAGTCN